MGGRVASMVAEALSAEGKIAGLVCLGYPFHPPGAPDKLRTAHLETLSVPTLICQGTRDPFGAREEVKAYPLSKAIRIHWLEDGDHDFRPRKESGRTAKQNLIDAADAVSEWVTADGSELVNASNTMLSRNLPLAGRSDLGKPHRIENPGGGCGTLVRPPPPGLFCSLRSQKSDLPARGEVGARPHCRAHLPIPASRRRAPAVRSG